MTDKNDGGPAFPCDEFTEFPGGGGRHNWHVGMSLRDYFAGQALAGFLATLETMEWDDGTFAGRSYALADAMLAARGR